MLDFWYLLLCFSSLPMGSTAVVGLPGPVYVVFEAGGNARIL